LSAARRLRSIAAAGLTIRPRDLRLDLSLSGFFFSIQ
jgi:hypothetical protein